MLTYYMLDVSWHLEGVWVKERLDESGNTIHSCTHDCSADISFR